MDVTRLLAVNSPAGAKPGFGPPSHSAPSTTWSVYPLLTADEDGKSPIGDDDYVRESNWLRAPVGSARGDDAGMPASGPAEFTGFDRFAGAGIDDAGPGRKSIPAWLPSAQLPD